MAREETRNWYYRARARAIRELLGRYVCPEVAKPKILDVGCGTGGTTIVLAEYGEVTGVEPSELAIQLCRESYPDLHVMRGAVQDLAALVPAGAFDLATVLGVLCHRDVPDPLLGLQIVGRCLKDRGWLVWGDCVYPCLAREHDEFVAAQRRFYPRQMHRLLAQAGFRVVTSAHLLGWAFPLAFGLAMTHRLRRRFGRNGQSVAELQSTDDRPLPGPLNAALEAITYWEWRLSLSGLKVPFGVSRLILARKEKE
jgi:SAM-dependent methyltransferase